MKLCSSDSHYTTAPSVMGIESTKMTNTIATNVTSTMLTNSDDKKVKYKVNCYIIHTALFVIIVLLIIDII